MDAKRTSSVSKAITDKDIGAFWDTHDFTEFDDPNAPDVEFEFTCAVAIEPDQTSSTGRPV
jgi:hypothetical protein